MQDERKETQQQGSDDICLYCELRGKHEPCWCKDKSLQDKLNKSKATPASPATALPAKVSDAKPVGTITAKQINAILNLAKAKQRSLPSNITRWSKWFASKYIAFLIALPFLRPEQPRFWTVQDQHFAATHPRRGAYYWNDGETLPESVLANQATQPQGD